MSFNREETRNGFRADPTDSAQPPVSAIAQMMTLLSNAGWVDTLGFPKGSAPFPYVSAAIFSMPLAFVCIWVISLLDSSAQAKKERDAFDDQKVRSETGLGAFKAVTHWN